jgi:hypothetical protein
MVVEDLSPEIEISATSLPLFSPHWATLILSDWNFIARSVHSMARLRSRKSCRLVGGYLGWRLARIDRASRKRLVRQLRRLARCRL